MSDEENFDDTDKPEEEFDFLEDDDFTSEGEFDTGTAPSTTTQAAAVPAKKSSNIKVIVILLIVSLLGGAYFYKTMMDKKKAAKPVITEKVKEKPEQFVLSEPATAPVEDVKKDEYDISAIKTEIFDELMEAEGKVDPKAVEELKDSINNMNKDVATNVNQIKRLQYALNEISKAIKTLNGNINILDGKIVNISESINNASKDIVKMQKIIDDEDLDLSSAKVARETIKYIAPEYTVHAVIPGRAWLKDKQGKIVTVTEGDTLGKYGQVAIIDVVNSIVSTSSGTSFR